MVGRLAPEYSQMPLSEVDAGPQCALSDERIERRVKSEGWPRTDVLVVSYAPPKTPELWVRVFGGDTPKLLLSGPWDSDKPALERFRTALAGLKRQPDDAAMLMGGLEGRLEYKNQLRAGSVSLCERGATFGKCVAETGAWQDKIVAVAQCYAAVEEAVDELLVGPLGDGAACEVINRHAPQPSAREACVCAALGQSAGVSAKAGRRELRISHKAVDLKNRPQPTVRLVEASPTFDAQADWHREGKAPPIHRLHAEDLDSVRAPLARCAPSPVPVVADLEVSDTGQVTNATIRGSANDPACLTAALQKARFGCRRRAGQAHLRALITWYLPPLGSQALH